jgi:tetratricopeptide (TPR) repeat protein
LKRHGHLAACVAVLLTFSAVAIASPATDEAQALVSKGDLQGALKRLDQQLSSAPHDAEARFARGLVLMKLNRNDEALKVFSELTRDYPQLPEPYNNLAVLYAQMGQYEKAREALEASLATHPSYATAHENLGDVYAAMAGAAYSRALALNQANAGARYKLSVVGQLSQLPTPGAPPSAAPAPAAPPMAAAPAPLAVQPPTPASDQAIVGPVTQALNEWAAAWSALDVERYISVYSQDFEPEDGGSRADWEKQRRERIRKATHIKVTGSNPEVQSLGPDRARVTFVQNYESDTYSDHVNKVLEFRNVDGRWLITREYVR